VEAEDLISLNLEKQELKSESLHLLDDGLEILVRAGKI
jgi:hypothetical protein